MASGLLDTDMLSNVMRHHPTALAHSRAYLTEHGRFTFSLVTRYEVLHGLLVKNTRVQQAAFEALCATNTVLPLTDGIIVRAAAIYADLHRRGAMIGDADILIAATALEHGLELVTNNTRHFGNITGLTLRNWLVP